MKQTTKIAFLTALMLTAVVPQQVEAMNWKRIAAVAAGVTAVAGLGYWFYTTYRTTPVVEQPKVELPKTNTVPVQSHAGTITMQQPSDNSGNKQIKKGPDYTTYQPDIDITENSSSIKIDVPTVSTKNNVPSEKICSPKVLRNSYSTTPEKAVKNELQQKLDERNKQKRFSEQSTSPVYSSNVSKVTTTDVQKGFEKLELYVSEKGTKFLQKIENTIDELSRQGILTDVLKMKNTKKQDLKAIAKNSAAEQIIAQAYRNALL